MQKLLILDQDRHHAHALGASLEGAGFEVRVTHDAAEALGEIVKWRPEAIIADAALPEPSNGDLAQRLSNRHTTLLLGLSRSARATRDRLLAAGFDAVIQKPASVTDVLGAISTRGESLIERARRHVVAGERRVAEQRSRIDMLRRDHLDTADAEKLLVTFERTLSGMREHLALEEREHGGHTR